MAERSLSELITDIKSDAQALAQEETALAKSEAIEGAKNLGIGGGLAGAAAFLLFMSSFAALFCVSAALHEGAGWPWWLSFLVVFALLVVIAVVLVLVAVPLLKKGNPTPTGAIAGAKRAFRQLGRAVRNPSGPRR
ncbi:phage holin family protein [Brevibacterium sp. 91QC2O2]|uniref:phage holin family protein n=1 Tax=Brevibacterium sp. 91QC2O2 TaxID=2968458 RepID=UPI00211C34F6|nr:phage holin family protein [Brevibacterium sp. 91QC2O2]MCQ9368609.1 phage holin family protein [Brevibacterium sp. 91QC2O2]